MVHGPRGRRRIALSFDDGPTELTREYLDVLQRYGVCATFFLVGRSCRRLPSSAESIALGGHEIGSHGFTHRPFPELSDGALLQELEQTAALLPGQPNSRRLVRPPHGSVTPRSLQKCVRAGFTTVLWSYDSGDSRVETASEILEEFDRNPPRGGDIVLLHEDHRRTLEALPRLLERIAAGGFEIVTVSELFRREART
jgi:peptidoglycan/xylan/chitin deacetylase (PgdA/CDA1 family)